MKNSKDEVLSYNEILESLEEESICCERALQDLAKGGACPNLLNDDNGHWALTFDGFQTIPSSEEPEDVSLSCFIESDMWKDTIREAMLHTLKKEQ